MSTSPDGIYEPGIIDPGFPVKNSTQSFWHSEPSSISKLRSSWVKTADIVIIGSGITGMSLARTLYSRRPQLRIVVVEARDLCWGATGRNGGHCKAMSPGVWHERKQEYGVDEAVRVMEYEHSHLEAMAACVKENSIDCDMRIVEGLDVYHDRKIFQRALDALEDMRKYKPGLASRYTVYTSKHDLSARNLDLDEACVGAIGMPAGAVWPYKFVTGMFQKMVDESGLLIQTNTTVTDVIEEDASDYATVKTDRGTIRATHVVHATNCWMGHLLHELRPFVSPVRANVQRHIPRPNKLKIDNYSFWLRYGEHEYDYIIQRPDGAFILGRASTGRRATSDDSERDLVAHAHLRGVTPQIFNFGTRTINVTHAWSGSVAFTQDGNPFVGHLPFQNRCHQWVCGGYQGIGMVRAFRSAQMLALLMLGEGVPEDYPRSMLLSEERVQKLKRATGSKL
ncbi:hypothetical protein CLAIMM_02986 [Cladophialophora immunda]|nr:hypothetical protein CLAIMM_02986 [Cladophialophora immunda]